MNEENLQDRHLSKKVLRAVAKWSEETVVVDDESDSVRDYKKYIYRKWLFMAACVLITVIVVGYAVTVGPFDIGFTQAYGIIWDHITGNIDNTLYDHIVIDLRMPRLVVGVIAGAALAVSGVVMQSTLLNPLADPYTTGVSSGASFGATLAIAAGATVAAGPHAIVLNAFLFSLIPTAVIIVVARLKNSSPTVMIMAGIAVMYLFNACTTVLMLWADPNDMQSVYEWQVGSLSRATWDEVPIMIVVTIIGIVIMQLMSRKLNVLATGDESANSLGLNASKIRTINLAVVSLLSAAIVSFTGLIGFVGLVAPHVVRLFIGPDNRYLIPASALFGGALLVCADLVGRVVFDPVVLQVGVVMAFLGGPMFLWLIMRKNSRVWS